MASRKNRKQSEYFFDYTLLFLSLIHICITEDEDEAMEDIAERMADLGLGI